ncbi:MAG TPA: alpha/beta hydrolase [Dehalococcoidia bacterium]|nr:alpha/beta hydrolase [Dehalococcoidia bacterium]
MAPEQGTVRVNGLRLSYLDWGGEGPAIVLHHATSLHSWVWDPIARRLARCGHVLAYDARGHGDSDKPPSGYGWDRFVQDLAGFITALDLAPAKLVGHSSGGTVALACAAIHPQLVDRVVALDPVLMLPEHVSDPAWQDWFRRWQESTRRRRAAWGSLEEAMAHLRGKDSYARWREDVLRLYLERGTSRGPDGRLRLKMPGELEAQAYEGRAALDIWSLLPSVSCPVLILHCRREDPRPEMGIRAAARLMARARLQVVPGSHFFPQEDPETVAAVIERFLA